MDIFVARQPIFDRDRRVVAYELLYRPGPRNEFGASNPDIASMATVESTLHTFGLDRLLGDKLGFYNASRSLLLNEHWALLPVGSSVIEVLEMVDAEPGILASCTSLKAAGYQLALDDFVFRAEAASLVDHADYIKIDFRATPPTERVAIVQRYAPQGITMLAEKVETWEEFTEAVHAGYALFQGYFFCRPEMLSAREVLPLKVSLARLIAEVNRRDLNFDRLEALIRQEVALSVKLLRYLRSASLGWRHEVESISQALRVLGERATRKWASLVAITMIGDDKPQELVATSLLRAQFCEELATALPQYERPGELFLVGLLSTLEALLDTPLPALLDQMSLGGDVAAALRGDPSPLTAPLELVLAWERGDWPRVETLATTLDVTNDLLSGAYVRSVAWVDEVMGQS